MNYRKMNGTGLRVSDICLGTMTFGAQTNEDESIRIIDHAIEKGVNFIDTADAYYNGESERIVGRALKGRREDIVLATKVRFKTGDEVNNNGLNRRHILKNIDASLKNLQTDYIDLYYLHAMDNDVDFEETLDTMATLVRSGKVRYVGVSNYPAWQISDMLAVADKRSLVPPIVTQNMYNIIAREVEAELVPCILKHKMGLTVYNPIAGGLLTGKYEFDKAPDAGTRFALKSNYMERYWNEENFDALRKLKNIADERNMSLLSLSLKWLLAHEFVDSVICGVSRLEQIIQNIDAIDGEKLDSETLKLCDDVGYELIPHGRCYFK